MQSNFGLDVAGEVRAEMGRQSKNQSQLARELGVTQAYVNRRLLGQVPITVDDLERIAAVLGVEVEQFLKRRAS